MLPLAEVTIEFEGGSDLAAADDRLPGILLLAGLVVSFAFIRMSTRLMRSPKVPWWPGSVTPGGLHIHHLVFGIVLMMLTGFLGFALQPDSPWIEILAALFGIGAGLTLDEFALWLHLEDVYWAEEGRKSVTATAFAVIIAACVVLGFAPLGAGEDESTVAIVATVAVNLAFCFVCVLKGKFTMAVLGTFIPLVAEIGAIRLARPDSPWAHRRYPEGSKKRRRSEAREAKRSARERRVKDLIGGAPHV